MTKDEIILALDKEGIDFNPNETKDVLHNILIGYRIANGEEVIKKPTALINALDKAIVLTEKEIKKDRSKAMRLKRVLASLKNAKRIIC